MAATAALARTFRQLHVPGKPLILTNIYDAASARAVAQLAETRALATASFAVASAAGVGDDHLSFEANLSAVTTIAPIAKEFNLPLTVDWQDGYGDRLAEGVKKLVELGVVGINLEDCKNESKEMYSADEATERIRTAVSVAKENGVPDFVVNARADSVLRGGKVDESIERGKRYLDAGATSVFVLGKLSKEQLQQLSTAFQGRLNIGLRIEEGNLTVKELSEVGLTRLSIGPQLQQVAMRKFAEEAAKILKSA